MVARSASPAAPRILVTFQDASCSERQPFLTRRATLRQNVPPHGPAWPCRHAPDRRREGRVGRRYWRTRSLASWGAREVSRSALQHDRPPPLLQQSRGSPAALERRRIPWWPRVSRPPSPSPLHQVQRRLECNAMIRSPVCQHHLEDSKHTQWCLGIFFF